MTTLTPLTHLMSSRSDSSLAIAYQQNSTLLTRQHFAGQVKAWYEVFSQSEVSCWGVYTRDSYLFATILVALWYAKKEVILLGDNLSQSIVNVADYAEGLVGEFSPDDLGKSHYKGKYLEAVHFPETDSVFVCEDALDESAVAMSVFTSGSTGEPKKIAIRFYQLINEIESHEARWGGELAQAPVAATVSHQHLYGLIFKVLWPLSAGRAFINHNISVVEELSILAKYHSRLTVVTTPSHLSRLPDTIDWSDLEGTWSKVFSSAAPLSLAASQEARQKFKCDVTEIYGSSETGGIAWRQQTAATGSAWQRFSEVQIAQDEKSGVLKLSSRFMTSSKWYTTADIVTLLSPDSFTLQGRIDRIAKVEGKRVSLTAIEQTLEASAWVQQARVITFEDNRVQTGAVVILSVKGGQALLEQGRKFLVVTLKKLLSESFETVVLPRKWRFVDEFPADMQGKVTRQKMLQLFIDE
ncbi:Plipastatin synthase subunit B [Thalassocella blandensis]|nr:Plipastatin synthase subunit B [Thalassocella blandensis]